MCGYVYKLSSLVLWCLIVDLRSWSFYFCWIWNPSVVIGPGFASKLLPAEILDLISAQCSWFSSWSFCLWVIFSYLLVQLNLADYFMDYLTKGPSSYESLSFTCMHLFMECVYLMYLGYPQAYGLSIFGLMWCYVRGCGFKSPFLLPL